MEKKTLGLTLILITVCSAVLAGFAVAASAEETNSTINTATTATSGTNTTTSAIVNNVTDLSVWGIGMMTGDRDFRGGPGGRGCGREFGGVAGRIEVSSAYNQTISNILGNDTDAQKLLTQGYNLTLIRPIVTTTIAVDGTLTTKATSAIVMLQNGSSGYAIVKVDITNAKVTEIVIYTRTVIDKTTR